MAISNSDISQPLWERAVALVQKQGMPVNASTIQSAMNTLAEGGSGSAEPNVGMDKQIDSLIARTDKAPVTSAPLQTPLPTQKPARFHRLLMQLSGAGMDEIALNNLVGDSELGGSNGQGPASLKSHEAEAPDARGKPITPSDTANAAPGTQGMNDMGLEDASATGGMLGSDAAMAGGGIAALLATLMKRGRGSPTSNALGNGRAGQLALPGPSSGPTIPMGGPDGWYPQKNNPGMRETGIPGRKMPASAMPRAGGGSNRRPGGAFTPGMGGALDTEIMRRLQ